MPSKPHFFPEIEKTKSGRSRARPTSSDDEVRVGLAGEAQQTSFAFDPPNQHFASANLSALCLAQGGNDRHKATDLAGLCVACSTHYQYEPRSRPFQAMTAPLGTIRDYDTLVEVVRARIIELDVTFETVDAVAGFAQGYVAKLLGPTRPKRFGIMSFTAIMPALGIKLVAIEDADALARVRNRLVKRRKRLPQTRPQHRADVPA